MARPLQVSLLACLLLFAGVMSAQADPIQSEYAQASNRPFYSASVSFLPAPASFAQLHSASALQAAQLAPELPSITC